MTDKPIKYVKHPLSAEDKALIISQGFKILDIRFKPIDLVEDEKPAKKKKAKPKA